jgi:sugar lactone lactonase YvrE
MNSTFIHLYKGNNGGGAGLNQLSGPNSVYYDYLYTNSLYVVDTGNNRVLKFPAGSTSATFGTVVAGNGVSGSGVNQLTNPRSVVVDSQGTVYVTDGGKR